MAVVFIEKMSKLIHTFRMFLFTKESMIKLSAKRFWSSTRKMSFMVSFLTRFPFTTNETELNHYHQKAKVKVASRVTKQLKTEDLQKLGNFKKIVRMIEIVLENCEKSAGKTYLSHYLEKPILHIS